MRYTKPSLNYSEQADLVISRGMICDRNDLVRHLQSIGYYRLSGYWHGFKDASENFKPGTDFSVIWKTYTFDRQLRLIVLDAIERVEIHLRSRLAYELSQVGGAFGFLDPANLPRLSENQHQQFIDKCLDAYSHSRERFIEHFKSIYGDEHGFPPYWMLVGTMDFGQILTLFRGAPVNIRNVVSSELGLSSKVLESWLICLNTVRNICAHHGRLWNRILGIKPVIPKDV
ncbi:MAG: Abi family protein, partial [Coriobacteriia bacterium]|nr:Abi family protein [Coriobacteriia bacterium]